MSEIVSRVRWPPHPGTAPITGQSLPDTYRHYFGKVMSVPPPATGDEYEIDNWKDCFMTAALWRRWKLNGLQP
jgi:hypothetical protein